MDAALITEVEKAIQVSPLSDADKTEIVGLLAVLSTVILETMLRVFTGNVEGMHEFVAAYKEKATVLSVGDRDAWDAIVAKEARHLKSLL